MALYHILRLRRCSAVGGIIVHCAVMDVNTDVFMASVGGVALRSGAVEGRGKTEN